MRASPLQEMLSCRDPWSCGAGLSDRAWLDGCAHVGAVPLPTSQLGPWRWDHAPTRPPALGDTAVRRLRRGRGATADVPAGTVAMDHVPTRPLGLGDTAKHVPTRAPASATPRIDGSAYVGGATADVPAGTGGDQHLFWGGDARILVAVRDPLQENQISHRGGRACGRGGQARTWLAWRSGARLSKGGGQPPPVRTRSGATSAWLSSAWPRPQATSRVHRARVLALLPFAGTRSASTQPLRRADLLRLASIAETSWAVAKRDQFRVLDADRSVRDRESITRSMIAVEAPGWRGAARTGAERTRRT